MTVQGRVSRYDGRGEVPKMQAVDTISSVDFLDIFICLCVKTILHLGSCRRTNLLVMFPGPVN